MRRSDAHVQAGMHGPDMLRGADALTLLSELLAQLGLLTAQTLIEQILFAICSQSSKEIQAVHLHTEPTVTLSGQTECAAI